MKRVLLLDQNNHPLRVCSWKRALVLILKGKAQCAKSISNIEDIINIDNTVIHRFNRLNYEVPVHDLELPYSRELSLDHVYPKSRLGPDIWENIVTCCKECNQYKADKTPKEAGMKLMRRPYRPDGYFEFEMLKYAPEDRYYWENWAC